MHDRVGRGPGDRAVHGGAVGHVEVRPGEGRDVVPARGRGLHHRAAEHAAGPGHEQSHQRIPISDSSPTMNV